MKHLFLSLVLTTFSLLAISQISIENPQTGLSTANNLKLTKVEIQDTATILHFHYKGHPNDWMSIPWKTFIQPVGSDEKKFIIATEGIPFGKKYILPKSGEASYQLIFPKIDPTTEYIDYGEANVGGNWAIYDIAINPKTKEYPIPESIAGNWFNKNSGEWKLGLYEDVVIFDSKRWDYKTVKSKKTSTTLLLENDESIAELKIVTKKGKTSLIINSEEEFIVCNDRSKTQRTQTDLTNQYTAPILKLDSTIYSGYIYGYNSRLGAGTIKIVVNDILTSKQNSFVTKINKDGTFAITLPIYYPNQVYVRSSIYNGSVFLEPGKDLFQLIGAFQRDNNSLCMGASGVINYDLQKLDKFYSYDYKLAEKKALAMTPVEFKKFFLEMMEKDRIAIVDFCQSNKVMAKAKQIALLNNKYRYACNIMEYDWKYKSAYRAKHEIPRSQRELPVEIPKLPEDEYDFITSAMLNDPVAVVSSGFDSFINRFKYDELLRPEQLSYTANDGIQFLKETGQKLSESDKDYIKGLDQIKELSKQPELVAFNTKYQPQISEFYSKHRNEICKMEKGYSSLPDEILAYFKKNNIELSDEENNMLNAMLKIQNTSTSKEIKKIVEANKELEKAFKENHPGLTNKYFTHKRAQARIEKMEKIFNVKAGFINDIMLSQDFSRNIVSEMTPDTDENIKLMQQQIATPFIANYLAICNDATIAKIEANKLKTGYTVNEVPKTEADKIFEAIIDKYKGKVIYVDFWATWCAPCRSGIERIKPLKEEMKGENVVFVYITSPSSPKGTWDNMIPDIKGEHYRVSTDEWNYLSSKFNITGIPHCTLVNKEGEVVKPHLGFMSNEGIKKLLNKYL